MAEAVRASTRRRILPVGWPIILTFGLYPIWWLAGLSAFMWPLIAVPVMVRLIWLRHRLRIPRAFGLYILFVLWAIGSGLQVNEPRELILLGYRLSLFIAAGALFLYVYNEPPRVLSDGRVGKALMVTWATVVVGGFLGLVAPDVSLRTPAEALLPGGVLENPWIRDLTHIRFAQVHDFLGYSLPRPSAPFPYTNEWGSTLALLTPMIIAFLVAREGRGLRLPVAVLLVASAVPAVMSVNRGLWLSLGIGLLYAAVRLGIRGRGGIVLVVVLLVAAIFGLVWFTDLREVVVDRLATPHSNKGRVRLAAESFAVVKESPLLGYGVPQAAQSGPHLGTHGLIWMLMVSHGIPAMLLFLSWLVASVWRTRSGRANSIPFWANAVLLIALIQMPYYGLLPAQLQIVMVTAAVAWRSGIRRRVVPIRQPQPEPALAAR